MTFDQAKIDALSVEIAAYRVVADAMGVILDEAPTDPTGLSLASVGELSKARAATLERIHYLEGSLRRLDRYNRIGQRVDRWSSRPQVD